MSVRWARCVVLALLAAAPQVCWAQAPAPEAGALETPTPAAEPAPAASPVPTPKAEEKPKINISGYLQVLFSTAFDSNDDGQRSLSSFQVRRARVQVKGELLPRVGYTILLDGASPNNLLRDGFISVRLFRKMEIRLGQQKTQFGYENPEGDTKLYVINRALVSDALARGPDLRDLGVGAVGSYDIDEPIGVEYGLTLVNGSGPNTARDETERKNFWGRLGLRYEAKSLGLTLRGGSSLGGGNFLDRRSASDPADDVLTDFVRVEFDMTASTKWFFLAVEAVVGTNEAPDRTTDANGSYVLLAGKSRLGLGPLLRWERYSPDLEDSTKDQRRITLGAYYDLQPVNIRLAVNYEIDDSEASRDNALFIQGQILF